MIVRMRCSKCGTVIEADNTYNQVFCRQCGQRMNIPANLQQPAPMQPAPVNMQPVYQPAAPVPPMTQPQPAQIDCPVASVQQANFIANFYTINPRIIFQVTIARTRRTYQTGSGSGIPFFLSPGKHVIIIRIGNKRYSRVVFINPNTPPVEMNCSWDGRARIVIHQPFYNTGYPNQPYYR